MATCSKCSQTLPEDGRFCIYCGQPVVISPPEMKTCPKCQAQLAQGSRFCVACGHDLQAAPTVAPVAPPAVLQAEPPVSPVAPPAAPPVVASKGSGPGLRVILAVVTGLALLAAAAYFYHSGFSPVSPPLASQSPGLSPSPSVEAVDLRALADTWSVDPGDPAYNPGSKEQNELVLRLQGQEVIGTGPDSTPFRFWPEGGQIVGEARDPQSKLHKLRWEWLDGNQKARIHLMGEGEKDTLSLRRGPAAEPSPPTLYELQADLNGDGKPERAEVVALDRNREPNAPSPKVLRIYDGAGGQQFESEPFEEPFHTDLDSTAEHEQEKAGLHLVPAGRFPRIRLIFATRSGNFVDFHFDGHQYVLAEIGD